MAYRPLLYLIGMASFFLDLTAAAAAPPITAAAFAPDGRSLVIGSQAGLEVRSWPELQLLRTLDTDLSHVHDLALSPDGELLLAAGGTPAVAGEVEVWQWQEGKRIRRMGGHDDVVYRVAWREDSQQWATASGDGSCHLHDRQTGTLLQTYRGHTRAVLAIGYLPGGKVLVSAGSDQTIQVWEAATGRRQRTLDNHVGSVNDLAVRNGQPVDSLPLIASASDDQTVRLWQPTLGRLVRFKRLPALVRVVAWSHDGNRLLVGSSDGFLRVIDPDSLDVLQEIAVLKGWIHTLAVPRRGTDLFLGGDDGQKKRWETAR